MQKEQSFGAILYYNNHNKNKQFVIVEAYRLESKTEHGFPKGHPDLEDNGNVLTTILREIQEETGISSEYIIVENFDEKKIAFSSSYETINKTGIPIKKTSTYYALSLSDNIKNHDLQVPAEFVKEIASVKFVDEKNVTDTLSHDNDRKGFVQRLESEK